MKKNNKQLNTPQLQVLNHKFSLVGFAVQKCLSMKKLLPFLLLFGLLGPINAQLTFVNNPSDGTADCEGPDPDLNADFQQWLTDTTDDLENGDVTSGCGGVITATPNYSPSDWVSVMNGCTFDLLIDWTVTDDCSSAPVNSILVGYTISDVDPPEFDSSIDGQVIATLNCDGTGNQAEIETEVTNFIASLGGADVMDDCTDVTDLLASITFTPNPVPGTTPGACNESVFIDLEMMDACGNTDVATVEIVVEDVDDPIVNGNIPDLVVECGDPNNNATILTYINTEAQALIDNGDLADDCTPAVSMVFSSGWSGDIPDCDGTMTETVVITYTDLCGMTADVTFDIIAEDTNPPNLDGLNLNPPVMECDSRTNVTMAQQVLDGIVNGAAAMDMFDCTLPEDIIYILDPPSIQGDPAMVGNCDYEYQINITAVDLCGNPSQTETIIIAFEDTTPPDLPIIDPNDPALQPVECFSDAATAFTITNVNDDCEGTMDVDAIIDLSDVLCESQGVIHLEFPIEDACGNVNPNSPLTFDIPIQPVPGNELMFLDPDINLPDDIALTISELECQSIYMFPNGVWVEDIADPNSMTWPDPSAFAPGVHYNDPCGSAVFTFTHVPTGIDVGGGTVNVMYMLDDGCGGDPILHEFEVDATCANCSGGAGLFCPECDTAVDDGCFTCNVRELLDGFSSCNPPFEGGIQPPPQPNPICNNGVPNNMSWFSFIAGSANITVNVQPTECIPAPGGLTGIQAGIWDFCDGMCISGDGTCPGDLSPKNFSFNTLIVGNLYHLFVDGCAGAECNYEITIEGQEGFFLDDMQNVTYETNCDSPIPDRFCPGQLIRFNVEHDGSSPTDNGAFDPPGSNYDPETDLCFEWSFNPPLNGVSQEVYAQLEEGGPTPEFELPFVTEPTTFEICILEVTGPCEEPCDEAECAPGGTCCIEIIVAPLPDEVCELDVCYEDLLSGFDPTDGFDDECGGGIDGWQGSTSITLSEVLSVDTLVYDAIDPECGCMYQQKIKINPVGNIDKTDHEFFMFECQFKEAELNGDFEEYVWVIEETDQEIELDETFDDCITLFELSLEEDWEGENCDSIINLTVITTPVFAELTPGPCSANGTEYFWELLIDDVDDQFPIIDGNYLVEWVECDDVNNVFQSGTMGNPNPPFAVTAATQGEYCVRVFYTFVNPEFPLGSPMEVDQCEEIFGPYDLTSDQAAPPIIQGVTEFCANDLADKEFSIVAAPGNTDTYTWNVAGTGAVLTSEMNGGANVVLDLTGYDFSQPIVVDAQTACGVAQGTLNLSTIPVPVPAIDVTQEICLGETAIANEINFGPGNPLIDQYIWTPTNNNSGGPLDFTAAAAGQQDIILTVIDTNGCVSDPVMASYLVVDPLETPQVRCGLLTDSSVEFLWNEVTRATGYIVSVAGGATTMVPAGTLSQEFTGLSIGQTITLTVTAIGNPPCGNSDPSDAVECTTTDCPPPLTVFNPGSGDVCTNDANVTFDFDINADILDVDGRYVPTLTPDGSYYDISTGVVDPAGLDAGTYVISTVYFYNNDQCFRDGPIYTLTVNEAPSVDFTLAPAAVCLGEEVTIDDTNVDDVASFDFDGGVINNGIITWDSPGEKTVMVVVETIAGCIDSSTQSVMIQDSLILGDISCASAGLDTADFDWDDVANSNGYNVSFVIDGAAAVDTFVMDSEIGFTGLDTGIAVTITVEAIPAAGFCETATQSGICITSLCTPLDFGDITCTEGLDTADFDWEDVDNTEGYNVTFVIDGAAPVDTFVMDSGILFSGLGTGVTVSITVDAVPAAGFCDASQTGTCTTSLCPTVDFNFNPGPFCFGSASSGFDLELEVLDPLTGLEITTGQVEWISTTVDNNGIFTPDVLPDNTSYDLELLFTDVDGCTSPEIITVEVIAMPEPEIESITAFCEDSNGTLALVADFANGEDILWEWPGGSANGNDQVVAVPDDIISSEDFVVTVTVTNGSDVNGDICQGMATATFTVEGTLDPPSILCNPNNTGVFWEWGPVTNANMYEVLIDNVSQGMQTELEFNVPATPGETFTIEVIAISNNSCSNSSMTNTCTATDCAPSTFADISDEEMCLDGTEMQLQFEAIIMNPPPGETPVVPGAWTGDGVSADGSFNPAGLAPGSIELNYSVEYSQNCVYRTSVIVNLLEAPQITNVEAVDPDCHIDNVGSVVLNASGGTSPYTYQISNLSPQDNGTFSPLNPGSYDVIVTDANGCASDFQFDIIAAVEPPLNIGGPLTLRVGEDATYTIEDFPSDLVIGDIIWFANETIVICQGTDCDPVTIDFEQYPELLDGFDLTARVIFNDDCFTETTIRVEIFNTVSYYIPNVFSNNATDDRDKAWAMFVSEGDILVEQVSVYDRWGELVHFKDAGLEADANGRIDLGWDGFWVDPDNPGNVNIEDDKVQQGVYVYKINLVVDGRQVIEANDVTVLR